MTTKIGTITSSFIGHPSGDGWFKHLHSPIWTR